MLEKWAYCGCVCVCVCVHIYIYHHMILHFFNIWFWFFGGFSPWQIDIFSTFPSTFAGNPVDIRHRHLQTSETSVHPLIPPPLHAHTHTIGNTNTHAHTDTHTRYLCLFFSSSFSLSFLPWGEFCKHEVLLVHEIRGSAETGPGGVRWPMGGRAKALGRGKAWETVTYHHCHVLYHHCHGVYVFISVSCFQEGGRECLLFYLRIHISTYCIFLSKHT